MFMKYILRIFINIYDDDDDDDRECLASAVMPMRIASTHSVMHSRSVLVRSLRVTTCIQRGKHCAVKERTSVCNASKRD